MKRLNKIIERCKAGIHLTIDQHKDYYESVEDYVNDRDRLTNCLDFMDMVKTNKIFELQFFPDTPVGSYSIMASTLDQVLDEAVRIIENE